MTDIIKQLSDLLANTQEFAKNHGVTSIQTYFDFIPDEILTEIFIYIIENLDLTLVCRRFNNVYISLIKVNPNWLTLPLTKILDWEDKIESFGILSQRELSLMCHFPSKIKIYQQTENNTTILECKKKGLDCCFYLNDEIYYMKNRCLNQPTDRLNDDNHIQFEIITSESDRYLCSKNNRFDSKTQHIKTYRSKHSICVVGRQLVTIISGDTIFAEPTKNFEVKKYNKIKYYFPKIGNNREQINKILLGEKSPYPITVMGNLSDKESIYNDISIEKFLKNLK
ncbi:Hypothetical protein PACV_187 [Pacmanvirus A23]|uniref:Hypothetical protein n=1 Tax=Pacmanvirus A23 TaxID=1932881 RepID=UPI000A095FA1|nr:Hypothetical protein B9W72_gp185 [Pacmanvirus A23]SIP85902.1 Hypothetical protein PACV_187 [Pacmanvirus A23]